MDVSRGMADGIPSAPPPAGAGESDGGCCEVYHVDEARVQRAVAQLPPDEVVQDVADTFKVLAHPTRVRILRALGHEELCVCDLSAVVRLSVSAVSHQLRTLRAAHLVRFRTEGKLAYYSVCDDFVRALVEDGVRRATRGMDGERTRSAGP